MLLLQILLYFRQEDSFQKKNLIDLKVKQQKVNYCKFVRVNKISNKKKSKFVKIL